MPEVELGDGLLPHLDAHNLGQRGAGLEDRLERVLVHRLDELLVGQLRDAGVPRAADVVEYHELTLRLALIVLEQVGRVDGAERADALRPRVKLPKPGETASGKRGCSVQTEGILGVGDGHGRDGRIVELSERGGGVGRHVLHGIGGDVSRRCHHHGGCGDCLFAVGGVVGDGERTVVPLGDLRHLPLELDLLRAERLGEALGERLQPPAEGSHRLALHLWQSRISRPSGFLGVVCLLLRLEGAEDEGAAEGLQALDPAGGRDGRERRGVARVDAGAEGLDEPLESLRAEVSRDEFLDGFLLARGRGPDADRAEARADLARPGEEGAEDRGGNVLGERPELLVPEDVAVRVGIGEEDVVPHARVARHGEDRVAGLVRVGTLLPDVPVLVLRGDVTSHAVPGLGDQHSNAGRGPAERERGGQAGHARAYYHGVVIGVGRDADDQPARGGTGGAPSWRGALDVEAATGCGGDR